MKDARDPETRENGANGDDRKGIYTFLLTYQTTFADVLR
jgi:hypothetical protein